MKEFGLFFERFAVKNVSLLSKHENTFQRHQES
jgi:hypothetical protein